MLIISFNCRWVMIMSKSLLQQVLWKAMWSMTVHQHMAGWWLNHTQTQDERERYFFDKEGHLINEICQGVGNVLSCITISTCACAFVMCKLENDNCSFKSHNLWFSFSHSFSYFLSKWKIRTYWKKRHHEIWATWPHSYLITRQIFCTKHWGVWHIYPPN